MTENPIGLTRKVIKPVSNFFSSPVAGGIVLIIASAAAIIVANSPLREGYETLLKYKTAGLSVEHWINDALMAVFFMMVGLEIKRELVTGQLATWSQRALPGFAALGGLAVPALIYVGLMPVMTKPFPAGPSRRPRILLLRSVYSPYWAVVCQSR